MDKSNCFWIYILECEKGNYYTGYTTDLVRRYWEHITGTTNTKYTKSFRPVRIAQCWRLTDKKGTALKIEHFIKSIDRKTKEIIVDNPAKLKYFLSDRLNLDIDIISFNPMLIESESFKFGMKYLL